MDGRMASPSAQQNCGSSQLGSLFAEHKVDVDGASSCGPMAITPTSDPCAFGLLHSHKVIPAVTTSTRATLVPLPLAAAAANQRQTPLLHPLGRTDVLISVGGEGVGGVGWGGVGWGGVGGDGANHTSAKTGEKYIVVSVKGVLSLQLGRPPFQQGGIRGSLGPVSLFGLQKLELHTKMFI